MPPATPAPTTDEYLVSVRREHPSSGPRPLRLPRFTVRRASGAAERLLGRFFAASLVLIGAALASMPVAEAFHARFATTLCITAGLLGLGAGMFITSVVTTVWIENDPGPVIAQRNSIDEQAFIPSS